MPDGQPTQQSLEIVADQAATTLKQWDNLQLPEPGTATDATSTGKPQNNRPTVKAAWKSVKAADIWDLPTRPCVREGFLSAIVGGAGVGSLRLFTGASTVKAANWAVGSFIFASLVAYETCGYRRRVERFNMQRAVEVYDQNKAEQKRIAEEGERRRLEAEVAEAARIQAERKWYKFW